MSRIKAFRGISPNPLFAGELICENTPVDNGPKCLKSVLEPVDRGGSGGPPDRRVYRAIRHTLQDMLKKEYLLEEKQPAVYVYEITQQDIRQTGVWAVTALSDYTDGIIKTHELTLPAVETRLRAYREQVGLEGSPILLTYQPDESINRLITGIKKRRKADITIHKHTAKHRLWKITDTGDIDTLVQDFTRIRTAYLADGHHRLFAAVISAAGKNGGYINSLYVASDQLKIREYDRVIVPEKETGTKALLGKINRFFRVSPAAGNKPVHPGRAQQLGMYCKGSWYELDLLPGYAAADDKPAAAILQETILEPVWDIKDPGSDRRLHYFGGVSGRQELLQHLNKHPEALAFTLYPVTVDQLISVAEKGEIMPPKSTWIDPKVPYGLLMHRAAPGKDY